MEQIGCVVVGKTLDAFIEGQYVQQSFDATKRGGLLADYSCIGSIKDLSGNINSIVYNSPKDGEWKNTPNPIKCSNVNCFLQDGKFVGAEGSLKICNAKGEVTVTFGCPLLSSNHCTVFPENRGVKVASFNKSGHPLKFEIEIE